MFWTFFKYKYYSIYKKILPQTWIILCDGTKDDNKPLYFDMLKLLIKNNEEKLGLGTYTGNE